MKVNLLEGLLAGVVSLLVITGVNMMVTTTMIDKAINNYALSIPAVPKIMVVNMDLLVSELTNQGIEPIDVLLYTQTLNALLVSEGYLVLDSPSVLSYHPRYNFNTIPSDKLFEAAKKSGIDLRKDNMAQMEEALKEGKKKVDDLLSLQ